MAALTEEQRQQWKAMLGAPFTFPARGPAAPRRSAVSPLEATAVPAEPPPPIIHPTPPEPAIHGPRLIGATPGRPFLFLIPATGEGPLLYSARHLPAGLRLDAHTGIISGSLTGAGSYNVTLLVRGPLGRANRTLTTVADEHRLALTPPLGWNSWNVWSRAVDAEKVRQAADWIASPA